MFQFFQQLLQDSDIFFIMILCGEFGQGNRGCVVEIGNYVVDIVSVVIGFYCVVIMGDSVLVCQVVGQMCIVVQFMLNFFIIVVVMVVNDFYVMLGIIWMCIVFMMLISVQWSLFG